MGLFDRFRKRVTEVATETDTDALSAEANTKEAQEALATAQTPSSEPPTPVQQTPEVEPEEEWEDLEALDEAESLESSSEDWDDFDDEEELALPVELTRKERKQQEARRRTEEKRLAKKRKEMAKRGAVEMARPKGSHVDLSVMRTTTGRQLVSVQSTPKGSVKEAEIETEAGTKVKVDLGGGVVSEGGRVIKAGGALDNLLEELEWVLLESDISSDAVTAVTAAVTRTGAGRGARRGAGRGAEGAGGAAAGAGDGAISVGGGERPGWGGGPARVRCPASPSLQPPLPGRAALRRVDLLVARAAGRARGLGGAGAGRRRAGRGGCLPRHVWPPSPPRRRAGGEAGARSPGFCNSI